MDMSRVFYTLLACLLLLSACGPATSKEPGGDNSAADQSAECSEPVHVPAPLPDSQEDRSEASALLPTIHFDFLEEHSSPYDVYAVITATGSDGTVIWEYTTQRALSTELQTIQEIGTIEDRYFFNCGGTVTCLDVRTGEVLWENPDFGGAEISYAIGDGVIYLCGYYGPDFYAISTAGETLSRIKNFDPDYCWPHALELEDGYVTVTFYHGPDGQPDEGHSFRVNLQDWTYETLY